MTSPQRLPLDLVGEWLQDAPGEFDLPLETAMFLLEKAARWGTLQRLEALLDD